MARSTVPQNIAQAMKCASKVEMGKACTMAELKATVRLLKNGMVGARTTARAAKTAASDAQDMVKMLLGRIGL